jgi:hypothetical protein
MVTESFLLLFLFLLNLQSHHRVNEVSPHSHRVELDSPV